MAEEIPGLLERMVRLQRAREAHENARLRRLPGAEQDAAMKYIAILEDEVRRVGLLDEPVKTETGCTCPRSVEHSSIFTPQDDCPVHGMLPVIGE